MSTNDILLIRSWLLRPTGSYLRFEEREQIFRDMLDRTDEETQVGPEERGGLCWFYEG